MAIIHNNDILLYSTMTYYCCVNSMSDLYDEYVVLDAYEDHPSDQDDGLDELLFEASQKYEENDGEASQKYEGNGGYEGDADDDDGLDEVLLEALQKYEQEDYEASLKYEGDGEYEGNADNDDGLDEVLLEASQKYEQDQGCDEVLEASRKEDCDQGCDLRQKCSERFSHCVSDREIEREVRLAVPEKTRQQTIWCYNVWCAWRSSQIRRAGKDGEVPP